MDELAPQFLFNEAFVIEWHGAFKVGKVIRSHIYNAIKNKLVLAEAPIDYF
jgi:hypothetical protein